MHQALVLEEFDAIDTCREKANFAMRLEAVSSLNSPFRRNNQTDNAQKKTASTQKKTARRYAKS
jgi:hypothetical protein